MATKFSQFTTGVAPVDATTFLVGYESVANTNNQYSKTDIVGWLTSGAGAISTLYTSDGTIGTTRKALITDTIQFRNAGDTKDMLSLNTNGAFALGLDAANTSETNVCIGIEAATPSVYGVAIGRKTSIGAMASYATVIGNQTSTTGAQSVVVGAYSLVGFKGATLGYGAGSASNYAVNIGNAANGSGVSSITLNANSAAAAPSTANTFGVYMTSNTSADFEVVGGGESTLNTNLKITGQGYTELHDTTNTTLTVDWNNSNIQELTSLTGSLTFTASNPKAGATYILTLAQIGTVTATWTGVKWPAATAPTLSGAGKTDVITLICYDATGAGLYYGASTLNFTT